MWVLRIDDPFIADREAEPLMVRLGERIAALIGNIGVRIGADLDGCAFGLGEPSIASCL